MLFTILYYGTILAIFTSIVLIGLEISLGTYKMMPVLILVLVLSCLVAYGLESSSSAYATAYCNDRGYTYAEGQYIGPEGIDTRWIECTNSERYVSSISEILGRN